MPFDTLEEAQAEILRLNEELSTKQNECENYSAKVNELTGELENVRQINQRYFLKLSAQYDNPNPQDDDDEDDVTLEDFAKTINI